MAQSARRTPITKIIARKHRRFVREFEKKHEHARKWFEQKGVTLANIREHSAKTLAGATLGSALLLAAPVMPPMQNPVSQQVVNAMQRIEQFSAYLKELFATKTTTADDETKITATIKKFFGIDAAFTLGGKRLPTYLGKIGLEQHLARFPGDTIDQHQAFQYEGMAPGLGAFRYFEQAGISKEQAEEYERFYIVLQTFLIPEWNSDWQQLAKWYKFRKFVVINPETGRAVVAVLGDSGPATWTGKQFGGSPEVMAGLGFLPKKTKGDVVVLFVDDPEDTIPLGPIGQKL